MQRWLGGWRLKRSLELAASGIDVAPARTTDVGGDSGSPQSVLKGKHPPGGRGNKVDAGPGIQGNQIYFTPQTAKQFGYFLRVRNVIIHIA